MLFKGEEIFRFVKLTKAVRRHLRYIDIPEILLRMWVALPSAEFNPYPANVENMASS